MQSIPQIFDDFLKIEKEQGFFNVKIYNVHIWNNVRVYIYALTLAKLGIGMESQMSEVLIKNKRLSPLIILKRLLDANNVKDTLKYLPFFWEKRDILCVLFPVRKKNGKYDEEVYVDKYYSQIKKYSYYALEWAPGMGKRSANPMTKNLRYTCDDFILAWFGKREHIDYNSIYRQFETLILKKLEKELGIRYTKGERKKIYRELYLHYYKRNAYIRYYEFLLKQIQPKIILYYNISEYYTQLLVETGKKYKIKTVEIQHGVFAREASLSHIYLSDQEMATIPDYYLTYGQCFNDFLSPKRVKTLCVGRPDIIERAEQYKKRKRNTGKKKILFISSCDGTVEYIQQVNKYINYEKYEVLLKLHPSEEAIWKRKYPFLLNMKDVKIVVRADKDIFYWINQADYIVGKWSTVFYEALPFPIVKILITKSKGSFGEIAIEKGYFAYVKEGETVIDVIEKVEMGQIQLKDFFQDDYLMYLNVKDRMDCVLNEIITSKQYENLS